MKKKVFVCMIVLFIGCGLGFLYHRNNQTIKIVIPEIDASQMEDMDSIVPDNEAGTLYFTCKNADLDIFIQHTDRPYYEFYIISLNPLDRRQIKVDVPIQSKYTTVVKEISSEDFRKTEYQLIQEQPEGTQVTSNVVYPYYLYQSYRGTDWKLMKELSENAKGAKTKLMDLMLGSTEEAEFLEAKKEVGSYEAYRDLYQKDYESLTTEEIPEFYVYNVTIWFGYRRAHGKVDAIKLQQFEPLYTESFQTIDIHIGEETYTEEIGEVRLIAEKKLDDFTFSINNLYWEKSMIHKTDEIRGEEYPWGDGSAYFSFFKGKTKKDITLTELSLYNSDATILDVMIIVRDEFGFSTSGKLTMLDGNVIHWDGKSPLELEEDTILYMYVIVQDPDITWLNYGKRMYPVLKYTAESLVTGKEKTYSYAKEICLERDYSLESIWVRYATVFEDMGYSLRDYFNEYYDGYSANRIFSDWKDSIQTYFDDIYEKYHEQWEAQMKAQDEYRRTQNK